MIGLILLALFNGVLIALARNLNGRLNLAQGPFKASWFNHLTGFLFLCGLLFAVSPGEFHFSEKVPGYVYLGGVIGALYVAVNSYILHRIGAVKSVLFVLGGQMITSLIIDAMQAGLHNLVMQGAGVILIFAGMYFSLHKSRNQPTEKTSASSNQRTEAEA
ncbi:DMT family transporter [Spongorhabdus nitratireducens]